MSDIRIVFSGSRGRMGRALLPGLRACEGLEVVGEVDVDDDLASVVRDTDAAVVVDFTTPQAAMPNARLIVASGAQGVIGTTGYSAHDLDTLEAEATAAGRGLLIAPNFSVGMVLLQRFAEVAVAHLPRVEIVETHHEGKLDAPSGTALRTAERLAVAGATPGPDSDEVPRGLDVEGVRVHSRRLPGIHARQEVQLAGPHEMLTLAHEAQSRDCYLAGVIAAVRAMPGRVGLVRGLDAILFGEPTSPAMMPEPAGLDLPDALRLVYIVDRKAARDWQRLDAVLAAGATCVWLRAPDTTGAELFRAARDLATRCRDRGARLLVGDRADVALAVEADGVQLGFRSPPVRRVRPWFQRWIGASCHSEAELAKAVRGADFAVLSPVFGVPTKGAPLGTALFARLCATVELPVIALGGIEPANAAEVRAAGAVGVAVIRALRDAEDPAAAARELAGPMTPR